VVQSKKKPVKKHEKPGPALTEKSSKPRVKQIDPKLRRTYIASMGLRMPKAMARHFLWPKSVALLAREARPKSFKRGRKLPVC
jgi:hypothetical protein